MFFAAHLGLLQGQCCKHKMIASKPMANTFMRPLLGHKLTAMLHCTINGNAAGNKAGLKTKQTSTSSVIVCIR